MEIVLVRHGQSVENIQGDNYDNYDSELTELGKLQAELVGQRIAAEKFDHVFSSPLVRALGTASIIVKHCDSPVACIKVSRLLSEIQWRNDVTCFTGNELVERYPGITFLDADFPMEKGWEYMGYETREMVYQRASAFSDYLFNNCKSDAKVLIISHSGFINAFIAKLLGLDIENIKFIVSEGALRFRQDNTCINRFLIEDGTCYILSINNHAHIAHLAAK